MTDWKIQAVPTFPNIRGCLKEREGVGVGVFVQSIMVVLLVWFLC
jgi:hypothetical protein